MQRLWLTAVCLTVAIPAWAEAPGAVVDAAIDSSKQNADVVKARAVTEGLTKEIVEKLSAEQLTEVLETMHRPNREGLPKEVLERLEPQQIAAVLQAREERRAKPDWGETLAPILVPLIFFGFLGFVMAFGMVMGHRQQIERQVTLRLMVEKGATIPPELLSPPKQKKSDLRRGAVLLCTGLGMMACFALLNVGQPGLWGVGLIPTLMGLGYLVVWKLEPNGSHSQPS